MPAGFFGCGQGVATARTRPRCPPPRSVHALGGWETHGVWWRIASGKHFGGKVTHRKIHPRHFSLDIGCQNIYIPRRRLKK